MNTYDIKGNWHITRGKLKQKWAQHTNSNLQYVEGKQDEWLDRIERRIGEIRAAI